MDIVGGRLWSLSLEDRGMRFPFDRGKKDGVITRTGERMKRRENGKRQFGREKSDERPS